MATPIKYARRVERTTALAILGAETSTSLMSAGRSTTTDLPTPSATNREVASPAAVCTGEAGGSIGAAAAGGPAAAIASIAAPSIGAIESLVSMMRFPCAVIW